MNAFAILAVREQHSGNTVLSKVVLITLRKFKGLSPREHELEDSKPESPIPSSVVFHYMALTPRFRWWNFESRCLKMKTQSYQTETGSSLKLPFMASIKTALFIMLWYFLVTYIEALGKHNLQTQNNTVCVFYMYIYICVHYIYIMYICV